MSSDEPIAHLRKRGETVGLTDKRRESKLDRQGEEADVQSQMVRKSLNKTH